MRAKANFSVFRRILPSGKMVFYYQCYDAKGKRQFAKSTGETKKTAAVIYCMKLFKDGLLIPEQKVPLFTEYFENWWDIETSPYLKLRQLTNRPLTQSTIQTNRRFFENHLKDYFAHYRLDEITPEIIENWMLAMSEKTELSNKKEEDKKKLSTKTINTIYSTLKVMLGEAYRKRVIKTNPCADVKELKEEVLERVILTVEEVRKLFPADWTTVWESEIVYLANRLAACTGLRMGEIRGLRSEYVFDDYVCVCGQFTPWGYKKETKTKQARNVPIPPQIRQELNFLLEKNKDGFVFSDDGGKTPINVHRIGRQFEKALGNIGISKEERIKRNLTFHAWRHFLNTLLRSSNVADSKVQSVTGHTTMQMTNHYTHFDTKKFTEVRDVQTELLMSPKETTAPKETTLPESNVIALKKPATMKK